jgi:hypothetical protein
VCGSEGRGEVESLESGRRNWVRLFDGMKVVAYLRLVAEQGGWALEFELKKGVGGRPRIHAMHGNKLG